MDVIESFFVIFLLDLNLLHVMFLFSLHLVILELNHQQLVLYQILLRKYIFFLHIKLFLNFILINL